MRRILHILLALIPASVFFIRMDAVTETIHYDFSKGLSSNIVGGGVQDHNGLLWFATWNGLNCYDGYEFHWVKIRPGDKASIGTDLIRDIMLSPDGNIICHTDDNIFEFDLQTYTFKDIPPSRKDSLKDKVGITWRGFTDAQGNCWTANRSGLYKEYDRVHAAAILDGTKGQHPRAFLVCPDGTLLVGNRESRRINIYDRELNLLDSIQLTTAPYTIFLTSAGDIWVGGKPGALMKLGEESITSDAVYDIKEDRDGRLWIATFDEGIKCIPDPDSPHPTLSGSLGGKKVRQILITPSGNLIAATTDGLLIGTIDRNNFQNTKLRPVRRDGNNPQSLCNNATMGVVQDSSGTIFIATESSGIDKISEASLFSADPVFTHVNHTTSTLTSDICKAMTLTSDSILLIAGGDNVMAYNTQSGQTVNYSRYFWADTCRFAETIPVILSDGSWLIGAEQGAFLATHANLKSRGYIPPLVFTTLATNGGAPNFCLAPRKTLRLSADNRNVSIYFAAIDYISNEGILYRTRVDDSPWTGADKNRSVTLFNLSPGSHTLEVQSTDRYGRWVSNNRVLNIVVAPYWHETWWAKTLFALLIIGIAGGIAYTAWYIRRVNRQRRELLDKYMALIAVGEEADKQRSDIAAPTESNKDTHLETVPAIDKPEDSPFLNRVRRYIEDNLSNPDANIDDMAAAAAASRSTLNRHLRSQLGISAAQLLTEARMQRAEQLLRDPRLPIADIAALCGYSDPKYFQRVFKTKRSVSPSEFRNAVSTPLSKL